MIFQYFLTKLTLNLRANKIVTVLLILAIIILMALVYYVANRETIWINSTWKNFMKTTSNNYILNELELLGYGFRGSIIMPTGKVLNDLRTLIPRLSIEFKSEIFIEMDDKDRIEIYAYYGDRKDMYKIQDKIKLVWYSVFDDTESRNAKGSTYYINNIVCDSLPYIMYVSIPYGLTYKGILDKKTILTDRLGECEFKIDNDKMKCIVKLNNCNNENQ